jgi:DNA (cytosine-5)-methyltransferase 1
VRFISLFAGIGGFDLGFERAGMACAAQVEIDQKCRELLAKRWPAVEKHDDVRTFDATRFAGATDVVCGGFPCQDLSLAGRRAGMAEGTRSALFYEAVRVVAECRPRWVVVENVPGLLTSRGGEDFRSVLSALDGLGYGVAWRILDSRWFGVPQRRRRIFVVGRFGAVAPAFVALHPECEGGGGDFEKGAEAREEAAGEVGERPGGAGFYRQMRSDEWMDDTESGTLLARMLKGQGQNAPGVLVHTELYENHPNDGRVRGPMELASTVSARCGTGGNNTDIVVHTELYYNYGQAGMLRGPLEAASSLRASVGACNTDLVLHRVSLNWMEGRTFKAYEDCTNRLTASQTQAVLDGSIVRSLTPLECERLQGFPDGWTDGLPKSARYRMLGNAVTVNVAEWIGRRIIEVDLRGELCP